MITLSRQPNTRAATSGGAARCSRVIAEMSTSVLPTPTTPSASAATIAVGAASDEQQRHTPEQQADREVRGDSGWRDSESATAAPSSAPMPQAACNNPTPAVPSTEQLQRDHNDEDPERTGHEALGAVQADQEPQPRLGGDRLEAAHQRAPPLAGRPLARLRAGRRVHAGDEVRAPREA